MAIQLERVLISDSVDSSCRRVLEEGGMVVDYRPGLSRDDLLTCIKVGGVPTGLVHSALSVEYMIL